MKRGEGSEKKEGTIKRLESRPLDESRSNFTNYRTYWYFINNSLMTYGTQRDPK